MNPLLHNKHYEQPSVFRVEGLLREARRQKGIPSGDVPEICLLDPDGDLFRSLKAGGARLHAHWACYHSEMVELQTPSQTVGVVGCAVGASYAVLVAEQLFASGCRLLVSITSAGQLNMVGNPPYFVLIDRALRDEGTSFHYLPPALYAELRPAMRAVAGELIDGHPKIVTGGSWTTDAPFRETEEAIAYARQEGLLAVEMEAAALYAFAEALGHDVLCFAHVTNRMATVENDFEKGEESGNKTVVELVERVASAWRQRS